MEEEMNIRELKSTQTMLINFVNEFKRHLGRSERVHWCQLYLSGLLLDGERKSIQPMSQRLPGGNEQALQQFVNQSPWDHHRIQMDLMSYLKQKLHCQKGILVLDDTSLPKKGKHSVGVARQYCGALGKVSNCQSLVTWHFAQNKGKHFPLLEELYLPEEWIEDKTRLNRCGVPLSKRQFKKKWELALAMLDEIIAQDWAYEAIVFDAGYGEIKEFRNKLDERGELFIGQVPESHHFWSHDVAIKKKKAATGRPRKYPEIADKNQKAMSCKAWCRYLLSQGMRWKKIKLPLKSKNYTEVMAVQVREVNSKWYWRLGNQRWLIIEKMGRNKCKYYVSNASENTSLKKLVEWAHERWKIEQGYQQLKEELGLDHFEGRSYTGLHHHVTLCFMAYAFLLLLRERRIKKTTMK
tara:strand:- start:126 stop:1352 length:1227 start_codon:yes stop_codon:yes gene_type:complete